MEILKTFFILLEVVLLFNLLILVHELGHFWAARWRGLVADKFAIWFGRPIWSRKIGGVEYRLGWIPAGGYVSIPQMAPMEAIEGKSELKDLPPAKPLDKIIVAFAGPLASFALAVVFACLVWVLGRPVSESELTTKIGYVVPDGPAAKAGLQPGDRILSVDGTPVSRFAGLGNVQKSVVWNIAESQAPKIPIVVERNGQTLTFWVAPETPERDGPGRKSLRQIGIAPAMTLRVARVFRNSPAAHAGIQPGDLILAVNDRPLLSLPSLAEFLDSYGDGPITLLVQRNNTQFPLTLTPQIPDGGDKPRVGIEWDTRGKTVLIHPNPIEQILGTFQTMWSTILAVASPSNEIGLQHLSGPVGIMRFYYLIFEAPDGWLVALWFSVFLNINLALLNLLPLPVLDGGHILLALIEAVRRRPLNQRALEALQSAFAALLIGLMLYVTFYDVLDLPWKTQPQKKPELTFSQPTPPAPAPTPPAAPLPPSPLE